MHSSEWIYLCTPKHIQKIKFIPKFIFWDMANSLFQMWHSWQHPLEMIEEIFNFHEFATNAKTQIYS